MMPLFIVQLIDYSLAILWFIHLCSIDSFLLINIILTRLHPFDLIQQER